MTAWTGPPWRRPIVGSDDARQRARQRLPRMIFDYIDGAAGDERAAARNRAALHAIELQPRVLGAVDGRTIGTHFLGRDRGLPVGIAPMGMCNLSWPGADLMMAAESIKREIPVGISTASSTSLEAMHAATGGRAWFQLYVSGGAEAGLALADRAEAAGYDTLILTVDVPHLATRPRDRRNGFSAPLRLGPRQLVDLAWHPHWSLATLAAGIPEPANFKSTTGANRFDRNASRTGADWDFLDRLRARWRGQLIVKGVMDARDARRIREAGADALYVSNHGGRQLDGAPAAIIALPGVRDAVGSGFPLIFDSGVRSGEDVVKAIALGADFVMLGRAVLYAIGADGARGLAAFLDQIAEEISSTLAQLGLRHVSEISAEALAHAPISNDARTICPTNDGAPTP